MRRRALRPPAPVPEAADSSRFRRAEARGAAARAPPPSASSKAPFQHRRAGLLIDAVRAGLSIGVPAAGAGYRSADRWSASGRPILQRLADYLRRLHGQVRAVCLAGLTVPQWHPRCFSSPTATLRCSGAIRWPCPEAAAIPCPKSRRPRLRCSAKTARAAPRAARSPPRRRAAARRRGGGRDARAAGPERLDAGSAQPLGRP